MRDPIDEPIDWSANPINALFRLIDFDDNGEPLPPEMIKWLAAGAREYLSGHSASIGRALGIESSKRGQPSALTRWGADLAKDMGVLWMAQLVDLGAERKHAASLVRERMLREYKEHALSMATLMDSYSRSSWRRRLRRGLILNTKMREDVVAFLAEFPDSRHDSQLGKRQVMSLYPK